MLLRLLLVATVAAVPQLGAAEQEPTAAAAGPSRHAMRWAGLPCSGLPYTTPLRLPNGSAVAGQSRCNPRHPPGQADGPLAGNGDVGVMLGGSAASNISLWLTKNDLWNLAQGEEPECRYGTFNYTLFVPPMQITDHCGTARSLDRNSQGMTAGLSIRPVGRNISDAGWSAVQHMSNGSVSGTYVLDGDSVPSVHTETVVIAPTASLTAKVSFVVSRISRTGDAASALDFQVGTHGGQIHALGSGAQPDAGGRFAPIRRGGNESWGAWISTTEAAPVAGSRKGKNLTVVVATRLLLGAGGGRAAGSKVHPNGHSFSLAAGGQPVWVVTALLSNIDNDEREPSAAATAALVALTAADIESVLVAHSSWWNVYWNRSSIALPTRTADAERLWYSSQYLLGASTRFATAGEYVAARKTAPAINSAWIFGSEHNAFTLDYNAEATFYGVASSNRPELVYSYVTLVMDYLANARIESQYFKCPAGLHFPGAIAPFGYENTNWMHMHLQGSFAALPIIWHWEYTRNSSFLTDGSFATADPTATPYALMKGISEWWVCHLTKETTGGGSSPADDTSYLYSDLDDCSQEDLNYYNRPFRFSQTDNVCNATAYRSPFNITLINATTPAQANPAVLRNPQIALGFIRKVLGAAIAASTVLGLDADLRKGWQDRIDHLAPFPRAAIPDPCQWPTPESHNHGKDYPAHCIGPTSTNSSSRQIKVLLEMEHPPTLVSEGIPSGGNPICFQGIFPGEGIGVDSPVAEREIARQTVETVGAMGAWGQSNSFPETINAAVRSGLDPRWILGNLSSVMDVVMPKNALGVEGQECAGASQAINDMLCSSYGGYIALFERWPVGENASFTTLRAKGGFLVSAALRSGVVDSVVITSEAGEPAILATPWVSSGSHSLSVIDVATGASVGVRGDAVAGTFRWNTTAGRTYAVSRQPTTI